MIIKKGFFTKRRYVLEGNILKKSVHPFFGLFHRKKEDESIDLTEVKYIYSFPLHIFSFRKEHGVEFVSEINTMYIPCLSEQEVGELVAAAKSVGATEGKHEYNFIPSSKALRKIYRGYSIVCDQFGQMIHKEYTKKNSSENPVRLNSIKYFDNVVNKGVAGIAFGGIAGGGIANTIEIFGLNKEDNKSIYKMITDINPKLVETDVTIFTSFFPLFKPKRWFSKRESLIVADWGVIHKQYNIDNSVIGSKRNNSRTSVVEYDSIKSYDSQGWLFKNIQILGVTSINSQERFWIGAKMHLWRIFKEKNVVNDLGTTYRAWFLYRWGIFGKKGENDPATLKCKIKASNDFVSWKYKSETRILAYDRIYKYEFKKEHWYSLVGNVTITGRRLDARAGEGGDVKMELHCIRNCKGKNLIAHIQLKKLNA